MTCRSPGPKWSNKITGLARPKPPAPWQFAKYVDASPVDHIDGRLLPSETCSIANHGLVDPGSRVKSSGRAAAEIVTTAGCVGRRSTVIA